MANSDASHIVSLDYIGRDAEGRDQPVKVRVERPQRWNETTSQACRVVIESEAFSRQQDAVGGCEIQAIEHGLFMLRVLLIHHLAHLTLFDRNGGEVFLDYGRVGSDR